MKQIFLDLRWLRGGNLRGIGSVSLAYMESLLEKSDGYETYLITTRKSAHFLESYLSKRKIGKYEILISSVILGDFFGISYLLKKHGNKESIPIYVGFGNTTMLDWFNRSYQHTFIHDFSWDKSFRRNLGSDFEWTFSFYEAYMRLNNWMLSSRSNSFIFVSDFVRQSAPNKKIYESRHFILHNPIDVPDIMSDLSDLKKKCADKSLCWIGGDAAVKNKQHFIDCLYILDSVVTRESGTQSIDIHVVGQVELPMSRLELLSGVNIINHGVTSHREMCSIISLSDTLLVPSITESCSIPAVVANYYSKSIVGTLNSPFGDWFGDNYYPITGKNSVQTTDAIRASFSDKHYDFKKVEFNPGRQGEKFMSHINDMYPLVVFHLGKQSYFKSAVKLMNKAGFKPIVISDSDIFDSSQVTYCTDVINDELIKSKWLMFLECYVHLHDDADPRGQLLCYQRWFFILDKIKSMGLDGFWHLDSDIAVFRDFGAYKKDIETTCHSSAISIPLQKSEYQMSASSHVSFWKTKDLESFIDFMVDGFSAEAGPLNAKWTFHKDNNIAGGICDMTFQYLWAQKANSECENQVMNINDIKQDRWLFNDNINVGTDSSNFTMLPVISESGQYFVKQKNSQSSPLSFMHCQGRAKPLLILLDYKVPIKIAIKLVLTIRYFIVIIKRIIGTHVSAKEI